MPTPLPPSIVDALCPITVMGSHPGLLPSGPMPTLDMLVGLTLTKPTEITSKIDHTGNRLDVNWLLTTPPAYLPGVYRFDCLTHTTWPDTREAGWALDW